MGKNQFYYWSEEELNIVKKFYTSDYEKCISLLPNRSIGAIKQKANSFGLYRTEGFVNPKSWTDEEIEWLKNNYSKGIEFCAKELNRTEVAIRVKLNRLGLCEKGPTKWTDEEIQILKETYEIFGSDTCAALLENRSSNAVAAKAFLLGIRRITPEYTKEEDDFILENIQSLGIEGVANELCRSVSGIKYRYERLCNEEKIKNVFKTRKLYTKEEDDFIVDNYHYLSNIEIGKHIGRSEGSVVTRIRKLKDSGRITSEKIHIYTSKEDRYIIEHCQDTPLEDIASHLGVLLESLRVRMLRLGIRSDPRLYSEEENKFIIDNYGKMTNREIGRILNRSAESISSKNCIFREKGLLPETRTRKIFDYWSEEETEILRKYYPSMGTKCAKFLPNRSRQAVKIRAQILNVKFEGEKSIPYTDEEVEILRKYYPSMGSECVKMLPNRTVLSVLSKASHLKIKFVGCSEVSA